ncbi:MAG: efflux RND transporter periplasmic adaptor subunit [Chloroflexota bacterium]|nr:efflux RND transporter periplasmic adaptor subunit [Chloroflexota bacterium]
MKRNVVIIGVVVIVVLIVAVIFGVRQMNANAAATSVRAQTAPVQRGTLVATLAEAGNVSAPTMASVAFQTSGRVAQVNVQVGDKVKVGQVLMTLDSTDLQLALKTAQTSVTNAQGSLSNAQASLDSAKIKASQNVNQLIIAKTSLNNATVTLQQAQAAYDAIAWRPDVGMTTQATTLQTASNSYQSALANYNITASNLSDNSVVRTAQTNVDQAQNSVTQAQISLTQAQNNLAKANLVSPINGTVSAVNFNVGDTPSGTAVVVADLSQIQVKVTVAEIDISKIKIGQPAQMTMDALPGKTYTATVASIGSVGAVTQGVVNYPIIVKLTDPDGDVLPGMTANLAIEVDRRTNVLLAPLRAIKTQGNQKVATVLVKGLQITQPVTTGLSNDTQVEVTSGLLEGDELVISGTTTTQRGGGGGAILGGFTRPPGD